MNIFKNITSIILFVILAIIYLACGYLIGFHQGYQSGQKDYLIYINKIFDK